jgi:hypothetical protein
MKNSFPFYNIKKVMINDLNKWSEIIKNRSKALESNRTLKKFIEGDIIKISNNCFHITNSQTNKKSTLNKTNFR